MSPSSQPASRLQPGAQSQSSLPLGLAARCRKKKKRHGHIWILQRCFSPLVIGISLFLSSKSYAANEVIILPTDPSGTNRAISLFDGANLPANSFFRIGTFLGGGTNSADLASYMSGWASQPNASSLLTFLNNDFVDWNSGNTTSSPWPGSGSISFTNTNSAAALVGKPMYIWVYNTTSHAGAANDGSQMLILRSWETNSLGAGFPDKDGGSFGPDSNFNLFPSTPSGIEFFNPDEPDNPIISYGVSVLYGQ